MEIHVRNDDDDLVRVIKIDASNANPYDVAEDIERMIAAGDWVACQRCGVYLDIEDESCTEQDDGDYLCLGCEAQPEQKGAT